MGGSWDRGKASAVSALSNSRNVAAAPGFVILHPGGASPPSHLQPFRTPKKTSLQIATVRSMSSVSWLSTGQLYFENPPGGVGNAVPQCYVCLSESMEAGELPGTRRQAAWAPFLFCRQ